MNIKCSCCGYEYEEDVEFSHGAICPRCFWEEDNTVVTQNDYSSPNYATLSEYRKTYYKRSNGYGK